jgi:DNA-binding response OmpR family regulator
MSGKCALVVDDDRTIRRLLVTALSRVGVALDEAPDGAAAMERLRAKPYDVLLLDMMMPKMNGMEVLARMERDGIDVPVIVLSAASEQYLSGVESGKVIKIFRKPFDLDALVAEVAAICGISVPRT